MGKLNSNTLVLNRGWLAVQVCSVRRAISLLYQGHAKVVDEDLTSYNFDEWATVSANRENVNEKEFINSPSLKIGIPRVIVLTLYDRLPRREVRFSRKNIFERDNYTCQYCGKCPPNRREAFKWLEKNELNMDHVIPRARGGKTTWDNVVLSCYKCNSKKGSKLLEELGWKLRSKPEAPKWTPSVNIPRGIVPHKQWTNFLELAYWNTELEHDDEFEVS